MHFLLANALTLGLVYRALSHKSLTPLGTVAAAITAHIHAIHPWSTLTMLLLISFYLMGTQATKIKHDIKSKLTLSSSNASSGPATRTSRQVLANSFCATVLIAVHGYMVKGGDVSLGRWLLRGSGGKQGLVLFDLEMRKWDALMVGVMAHYAATTADTLSSELGILSRTKPRLVLPPFRTVLPGTNGGVTLAGLISGITGSAIIAGLSTLLTPFSPSYNSPDFKLALFLTITTCGTIGTLLDSVLGATLQASVVDIKRNKIVESDGGTKVLVTPSSSVESVGGRVKRGETEKTKEMAGAEVDVSVAPSRKVVTGLDLLDNNMVNMLMAGTVAAIGVQWGLMKSEEGLLASWAS